MIVSNDSDKDEIYFENNIPKMKTKAKTPRNIKSKSFYKPEPHPATKNVKNMHEFNNLES